MLPACLEGAITASPHHHICITTHARPLACRYAATEMEVSWLCGQALLTKPVVMGVDMEWRPQYTAGARQHPVALVQVCYVPGNNPAGLAVAAGGTAGAGAGGGPPPGAAAAGSSTSSSSSGVVGGAGAGAGAGADGNKAGGRASSGGGAGSGGGGCGVSGEACVPWDWDRTHGTGLVCLLLHVVSAAPAS